MTLNEYQKEAKKTANLGMDFETALAVWALGIAGEAGEVADHIKKFLSRSKMSSSAELTEEIGDVLWYLAILSDHIGVKFETIAALNLSKLQDRYPNGFKGTDEQEDL